MLDTKYRKAIQPAVDLPAKLLCKTRIRPNHITSLALVTGIVSSIFIGFSFFITGLVLLWISGFLDVLDGTMARLKGQSSKEGAYMDLIFDRMVEAAVMLGLYFALPQYGVWYLLFLISALFNFTTFTVAGALYKNEGKKSMHYDVGLIERTEAFIGFSLVLIFPSFTWLVLLVLDGLIFLTGIARFYRILRMNR